MGGFEFLLINGSPRRTRIRSIVLFPLVLLVLSSETQPICLLAMQSLFMLNYFFAIQCLFANQFTKLSNHTPSFFFMRLTSCQNINSSGLSFFSLHFCVELSLHLLLENSLTNIYCCSLMRRSYTNFYSSAANKHYLCVSMPTAIRPSLIDRWMSQFNKNKESKFLYMETIKWYCKSAL